MKYLLITLPFLLICCKLTGNQLEPTKQTVTFEYIAWACECANWIEPDTAAKYENAGGGKLSGHCIFIEAADTSLKIRDTVGYSGDMVEFTGQFYKNKGYANDYVKTEETVDKARVFRYTSYKVIRSHYRSVMNELKKATDKH